MPLCARAPRTRRLPAIEALLILGMAGCATSVTPQVESSGLQVPAAWSEGRMADGGKTTALSLWWTRFSDPLLTRLVDEALDGNVDISQARGALEQARALREAAVAALSPTLAFSTSTQRTVTGDRNSLDNFQAGVNAGWGPDLFGAKQGAVDASAANLQTAQARLAGAQGAVASSVALNYIALRSAQLRLDIARKNLTSQLHTLQITRWRNQAGLIGAIEVEQALIATDQTRSQLPPLELAALTGSHALAIQTGKPPSDLRELLSPSAPVPRLPADIALPGPQEVLRNRPDVRASYYQVGRAEADVAQAQALRYPTLNTSANLGVRAASLAALSNGSSLVASALISLSGPLFDAGAASARVDAQQAALVQAQASYRATILLALQQVEDSIAALRVDSVRLGQLGRVALSADRAALMARQRYASGLVDFQIVLETQRTQFAAQDNAAQAAAQVSADQVRLYNALGGGWQPNAAELVDPPHFPGSP